MSTVYSASILANQGFQSPEPISPNLPGWTVSKEEQSEIYIISHNLNQSLNVVATPTEANTVLNISASENNRFIINSWTLSGAPRASGFTFIAIGK